MDFLEDTAIVLGRFGIHVHSEASGKAAIASLRRQPCDVLLIDIDMPETSGFDLLARLRRSSRTASVPAIFLTAHSDQPHILRGLREGIDDYLTKPFHPEELVVRIERIHARRAMPAGPALLVRFPAWNELQKSSLAHRASEMHRVFLRTCEVLRGVCDPKSSVISLGPDLCMIPGWAGRDAKALRVIKTGAQMLASFGEALVRSGDYLERLPPFRIAARVSKSSASRSIDEQMLFGQDELLHSQESGHHPR